MKTTKIGNLTVSRFLLGSNPFSGFSHQGVDRDQAMVRYYTTENIKKALREAEKLGITGVTARTDHHVMRVLKEYWNEGGKLKWLGQTCPGVGPSDFCVREGIGGGASACHIHGGVMDFQVAQKNTDDAKKAIEALRKAGLPAGIAGHNVKVFEWALKNLDVDYYMCCYYNPTPREDNPEHIHGAEELYREADRDAMTAIIKDLPKPVIHYKILAAGRTNPEEAFKFCSRILRPQDLVCVGIYLGDDPGMLRKDVELFKKYCDG
jgi:hypothetical protein